MRKGVSTGASSHSSVSATNASRSQESERRCGAERFIEERASDEGGPVATDPEGVRGPARARTKALSGEILSGGGSPDRASMQPRPIRRAQFIGAGAHRDVVVGIRPVLEVGA